ncbi:MAG: ABC transporter permease [Acidobacteriota bacterium]|nr:ABC transporter permease [Acidobacteriota bacterium]
MILRLAVSSLHNRLLVSALTVFSIALSVALLLGVEQVRTGLRESFSNTISGTDLIVGTRVGKLQLVLFTVFGIGSTPDNIDYETFDRYRNHPAVAWAVPFSLGDSHRGFRVVATDATYFEHVRHHQNRSIQFVSGQPPKGLYDAVIGHKVAEELGYRTGTKIVVSHGMSAGILDHDEHPFTITGVLDRTATPIDHTVYITLAGMEAIHAGWPANVPVDAGNHSTATRDVNHQRAGETGEGEIQIASITAFFLGLNSRIDTMRLQREINSDKSEPLLAIIPGVALSALWRGIDMTDSGLKAISGMVILVGLTGMLVSLLAGLQERRREMAILRAVGARPGIVVRLLLLEAAALTFCGLLGGLCINYGLLALGRPLLESAFGLVLPIRPPSVIEWAYLGVVWSAGILMGLAPALNAYRNTLVDGLSVRV